MWSRSCTNGTHNNTPVRTAYRCITTNGSRIYRAADTFHGDDIFGFHARRYLLPALTGGAAILSTDRESFREAVRHSHALWGGRFKPFGTFVERPEAHDIVRTYRADFVVPLGGSEAVKAFAAQYEKYLIPPFFPKITMMGQGADARSHLLDGGAMRSATGETNHIGKPWRPTYELSAGMPTIRLPTYF